MLLGILLRVVEGCAVCVGILLDVVQRGVNLRVFGNHPSRFAVVLVCKFLKVFIHDGYRCSEVIKVFGNMVCHSGLGVGLLTGAPLPCGGPVPSVGADGSGKGSC